jgi:Rrf2 family protein
VHISAKADYAVRAVLALATLTAGRPMKGQDLARAEGISFKFLENILLELRRAGIVASQRGADGGYWLARPAGEVSVAEVIRAVDGPLAEVHGLRPEAATYDGPSQHLQEVWIAVRASVRAVLESVTLADLTTGNLPTSVRQLASDPEAWKPH